MEMSKKMPEVVLRCSGYPDHNCQANYVGMLGIHVCVGDVHYPVHTECELEMSIGSDEGLKQCALRAIVSTYTPQGLTLFYTDPKVYKSSQLLDFIVSIGEQSLHKITESSH